MAFIFKDSSVGVDGNGYGRSSRVPAKGNDFFGSSNSGASSLSAAFGFSAKDNPEGRSFGSALVQGTLESITSPTQSSDKSLMSKILPGKSYAVASTGNIERSASKQVTDGAKVSGTIAQGKTECTKQIGEFQKDFKEARAEITAALKEAAKAMNVDPDLAADTMLAKPQATMIDAIAMVGSQVATSGAGSMATHLANTTYVALSASQSDKKLDADQQQKLLEDTLKILQSTPASPQAGVVSSPFVSGDSEKLAYSRFNWQAMTTKDLKDFMDADPSGETQPEMVKLRNEESHLKDMDVGKNYVADNYHAKYLSIQENADDVTFDQADCYLAGESLCGISSLRIGDVCAMDSITDIRDTMKDVLPSMTPPPMEASLNQCPKGLMS